MPIFLVLWIYLLSGDDERAGWNRFLHGGSIENRGDNYGASILTDIITWRLLFLDDDVKMETVSPLWNNFL
jgi:hypothetical protein